ncbi:MAG: GNAT family N-acetyltransferase [Parachlamydiaceae bacterium]|nr:GNAT family N-acetyltransferase [Parachlamydiaceae bacterium]
MQHIIDWAKQSDTLEKIELNVRASNGRAIALYKKMGFIEEGRLKNRVKIDQSHYIDDGLKALSVNEKISRSHV